MQQVSQSPDEIRSERTCTALQSEVKGPSEEANSYRVKRVSKAQQVWQMSWWRGTWKKKHVIQSFSSDEFSLVEEEDVKKSDQPSKFDVKEQIEVITTATTTAKSITVHSRFHFKERPEPQKSSRSLFRTFSVLIHNLCLNILNEASKAANNVNKYPSTCTLLLFSLWIREIGWLVSYRDQWPDTSAASPVLVRCCFCIFIISFCASVTQMWWRPSTKCTLYSREEQDNLIDWHNVMISIQ